MYICDLSVGGQRQADSNLASQTVWLCCGSLLWIQIYQDILCQRIWWRTMKEDAKQTPPTSTHLHMYTYPHNHRYAHSTHAQKLEKHCAHCQWFSRILKQKNYYKYLKWDSCLVSFKKHHKLIRMSVYLNVFYLFKFQLKVFRLKYFISHVWVFCLDRSLCRGLMLIEVTRGS